MTYELALFDQKKMTIADKLRQFPWSIYFTICILACIGFAMLYSAANGSIDPYASRQMIRFAILSVGLLAIALFDLRFWLKYAYLFYFLALVLLIAVAVMGSTGGGAQRWLDLGVFQLQPSEIMKLATILALARFFHGASYEDVGRLRYLLPPIALIALPSFFIMRQPDLGTTLMLLAVSGAMMFLAGVRIWMFVAVIITVAAAVPIAWEFYMRDYQKDRVLTFLDPGNDPLGAGYHIIQSKIALGSGGVFGKGFMEGTQSHLNFLPEKQTDFIFTMLAEEFGLIGGIILLCLYTIIFIYGFYTSYRCRNQFGRLVGLGITVNFFLYVFINIAMVIGLIPVVGVPLPLISFGGSAMLTVLAGFGLLFCVSIHREIRISRNMIGIDP